MKPPTKTPASESLAGLVGQSVDAIDTPALVVDLDAVDRNITRMAEFARKHGILWRPHAKMHKSVVLAQLQLRSGAVGVCVQKTAEAEIMADGGIRDIYISNEVVAGPKLARVAALALRLTQENGRLAIAVDSVEGITRLGQALNESRVQHPSSATIDVFVEIDVGQGRCGVAPGGAALALAQAIHKHPRLRFAGLQAYHGKAQHLRGAQERRDAIARVVEAALSTRKLMEAHGITVDLVTGAGTGTLVCEAASGVFGEVQAGSFMFMDADYAHNERDAAQPQFEHALFVKTQVISSGEEHAVCDAGHKSHAIDSGLPKVLSADAESHLEYFNGGDEHGVLRPAGAGHRIPAIGRMLWLIPGHCDPTVNLHDFMIGVRGGLRNGTVEQIIRVDARGALT
jgi:D-serine deaminase-like pyridoxal phosphate-dependent protein